MWDTVAVLCSLRSSILCKAMIIVSNRPWMYLHCNDTVLNLNSPHVQFLYPNNGLDKNQLTHQVLIAVTLSSSNRAASKISNKKKIKFNCSSLRYRNFFLNKTLRAKIKVTKFKEMIHNTKLITIKYKILAIEFRVFHNNGLFAKLWNYLLAAIKI